MQAESIHIKGPVILRFKKHSDLRGDFFKPFNDEQFRELGLKSDFREYYFSVSKKNVIRGMHYQRSPHAYHKLIFVNSGTVLDVLLDVRRESNTYGESFGIQMNHGDPIAIYLPPGIAHGFLSLCDDTIVSYLQTSVYHPEADAGIRYDSFGYSWPVDEPILSARDNSLIPFSQLAVSV